MKLGIVSDGEPAPLPNKGAHPAQIFGPCLLWPNGLMHQDIPLGTERGLDPGHTVLDGDPAPPQGAQPPHFRPMSIVAKRSPISATAEHLLLSLTCLLTVGKRHLFCFRPIKF